MSQVINKMGNKLQKPSNQKLNESQKKTQLLMDAMDNEMWSTVQLILSTSIEEIDFSHRGNQGQRILTFAVLKGKCPMNLRLLIIKHCPRETINFKFLSSNNILLFILKLKHNTGYNEIIKTLIEQGINIEYENKDGETAMQIAIQNKNDEIAAVILSKLEQLKIQRLVKMCKNYLHVECIVDIIESYLRNLRFL